MLAAANHSLTTRLLLVVDDDVRQWAPCFASLSGWRVAQAAWRDLRCHVPAGRLPQVHVRQPGGAELVLADVVAVLALALPATAAERNVLLGLVMGGARGVPQPLQRLTEWLEAGARPALLQGLRGGAGWSVYSHAQGLQFPPPLPLLVARGPADPPALLADEAALADLRSVLALHAAPSAAASASRATPLAALVRVLVFGPHVRPLMQPLAAGAPLRWQPEQAQAWEPASEQLTQWVADGRALAGGLQAFVLEGLLGAGGHVLLTGVALAGPGLFPSPPDLQPADMHAMAAIVQHQLPEHA